MKINYKSGFICLFKFSTAQFSLFLFVFFRILPFQPTARMIGWLAETLGPLSPRHRIASENLRLSFPEKTETEKRKILKGMWNNLGRNVVEFFHIDQICDVEFDEFNQPTSNKIEVIGIDNFIKIRDTDKAAIIFTGHIANWEILSACATHFGLKTSALYRPPSNQFFARYLHSIRKKSTVKLIASRPGAASELVSILRDGGTIGVLIDQNFLNGVDVPFFGRPAKTSPLIAKLARNLECPVHGARAIRLPGGRFRLELSDEIKTPRNADGEVDVLEATALFTNILEGWIRQYPEQWLWAHRRWKK